MFKKLKKHPVISIALALLLFGITLGATTWDMTFSTISDLWVGASSDTPTRTLGANSVYIKGDVEIDGTLYSDGGTTATSVTRSFPLPIAAAGVDGSNDIDEGTAPDISTVDEIPAAVWANSGETAAIQWTFRLPSDFSSGLVTYALVSSDDASGTGTILDWAVTVNTDDGAFASPTAQTAVECTSATLDASNEVLTLTSDATAEALYIAGTFLTLELFNASTADDTLELKGVEVTYTATH